MSLLAWIFLVVLGLSAGTYVVQHCICAFFYKTQNLKRRYNAQWALVTGASSGEVEKVDDLHVSWAWSS